MTSEELKRQLAKSKTVEDIPLACSNELAAVEFLEKQRWGNTPACVKCGSVEVYKMKDAKTGERNSRYLWRCRDCKEQYTVRIGTVYEESRIELRHWCYAFWRACTSKKGVSALEIKRHCQISYKSALFLMNRIRFAMAPDAETPQLKEQSNATKCISAASRAIGRANAGRWLRISLSCFVLSNAGQRFAAGIIADVKAATLKCGVPRGSDQTGAGHHRRIRAYRIGAPDMLQARESLPQHARIRPLWTDIHTNTAESTHALVKRGIVGIYHNVSREYLHRYLWQFDFLWNNRKMNDGERTVLAMKAAEGKRLMYREPSGIQ